MEYLSSFFNSVFVISSSVQMKEVVLALDASSWWEVIEGYLAQEQDWLSFLIAVR